MPGETETDETADAAEIQRQQQQSEHLSKLLAQRKGVMTRYMNKSRRLITERDPRGLGECLAKMKDLINEIEQMLFDFQCMNANHATFNDAWLQTIEDAYIECVEKSYVELDKLNARPPVKPEPCPSIVTESCPSIVTESCPPAGANSTNTPPGTGLRSSEASDLITWLDLPKVEITPFNGDPLQYHVFINSFKENVDRVNCSVQSKLTRLIASTTGLAKEAIIGFQVRGDEEAYQEALQRLEDQFG